MNQETKTYNICSITLSFSSKGQNKSKLQKLIHKILIEIVMASIDTTLHCSGAESISPITC